ncbi:MAG TPA: DUF2461 domain-containing protein [Acidobacteriaceae bacterium]
MAEQGAHFSKEAMTFLRGLARHNERAWFDERKPVYERALKAPMLEVIAEINQAMAGFAPEHVRPPQRAMMRIYRDTRFAKEKIPYKTHLAAWWARTGLEKTSGAGYYLQVSPSQVLVAAGCYMPQKDQLLAIRRYLLAHHEELRALLADRRLTRFAEGFDGLKLTRAPKGFPAEHPAMDLIVCRQWGVSSTLGAEVALDAKLVKQVVERFRAMTPLVEFLNRPLAKAVGETASFGL